MPVRLPQDPLSSLPVPPPVAPANHDSSANGRLPPRPSPSRRQSSQFRPPFPPLSRPANRPAPAKVLTASPPIAPPLPSRSTPAGAAPSSPFALPSRKSFSQMYPA